MNEGAAHHSPAATVGALLVVRDEERLIRRCLESFADVVGQIVVVHDGECRDRTLEICREFTDRIYVRPFQGSSDFHKPFGLSKLTSEWVLEIDADEFLSDATRERLGALVRDPSVDCYLFKWPLWDGAAGRNIEWISKRSLFRRNKAERVGLVHGLWRISGRIVSTDLVLEHRPQHGNQRLRLLVSEELRRARLAAAQYCQDPDQWPRFRAPRLAPRLRRYSLRWPLPALLVDQARLAVRVTQSSFLRNHAFSIVVFRRLISIAVHRAAMHYYIWRFKKGALSWPAQLERSWIPAEGERRA